MIGRMGVCSWSLGPESPEALTESLARVGASGCQLALDPIRTGSWSLERTKRVMADAGLVILSGMMATVGEDYSTLETIRRTGGVRPDEHWQENQQAASDDARIAAELGIELVTFHAGFLPHDAADPERVVLIDRLREIADIYSAAGVCIGFETGQETASTLLSVLASIDRAEVGVNFDPANMILYGMGDPGQAIVALGSQIAQAHVKDALPSPEAGQWGREVVAGTGAVDWSVYFATLARMDRSVDLLVEREAGDTRERDIATALGLIEAYLGKEVTRG